MARKKKANDDQVIFDLETIEQKITSAEEEIAELGEKLKAKKSELKKLAKAKVEAEAAEADRLAQEKKAALLAAIEASGKSVEEILELLK